MADMEEHAGHGTETTMSRTRFSDPDHCVNCGVELATDDDTFWINEEPPGYLYPGSGGDPVCHECYMKGPGGQWEPDTVEELNE